MAIPRSDQHKKLSAFYDLSEHLSTAWYEQNHFVGSFEVHRTEECFSFEFLRCGSCENYKVVLWKHCFCSGKDLACTSWHAKIRKLAFDSSSTRQTSCWDRLSLCLFTGQRTNDHHDVLNNQGEWLVVGVDHSWLCLPTSVTPVTQKSSL